MAFSDFLSAPRIIVNAELVPIVGTRFQPTGFPNIGAAEYTLPVTEASGASVSMLLVESPQSIANRLEAVAWDDASEDLAEPLRGMPFVKTVVDGQPTNSLLEAHRLNSPYLGAVWAPLRKRAEIADAKKKGGDGAIAGASAAVNIRKLAAAVFAYDPNAVLHGVFMTNIVGQARLTRLVSGFIEARNATLVASGGVKNDRLDAVGKDRGGAERGFGNVPFARSEYAAERIEAAFSFDNQLLRDYGLPAEANELLLAVALWKILRFLAIGLRLRTACDLEVKGAITVTRPDGLSLPEISELELVIRKNIAECRAHGIFVEPATTEVTYAK